MNQFLVLGLLAVLFIATCFKEVEGNAKERIVQKMAQRCKDREGASDDDVNGLMKLQMPETRVQKCFNDCIHQQIGLSDGSKFRKDGFLQRSRMLVGNSEEKQKAAKEIADECANVSNEDNCELAADIIKCIRDGLQKRGISRA